VKSKHEEGEEKGSFKCEKCKTTFNRRDNLKQHVRVAHGNFLCDVCDETFDLKGDLIRHMKSHKYSCDQCHKEFTTKSILRKHMRCHYPSLKHSRTNVATIPPAAENETSGLNRRFVKTRFEDAEGDDIPIYLKKKKEDVRNVLSRNEHRGIKWYVGLSVFYIKETDQGVLRANPVFRPPDSIILSGQMEELFERQYNEMTAHILEKASSFQRMGSNWVFDYILHFDVNVAAYEPLGGSSFINLPDFIKRKHAVLNLQNLDNKCFQWSVLAARFANEIELAARAQNPYARVHSERVESYYQYEATLNMEGISQPTPISQVPKFEKQNPSFSINVISYDIEVEFDETTKQRTETYFFFPLHASTNHAAEHKIDLLYISNEQSSHYAAIRNMSRLLGHTTLHNGRSFHCGYCLRMFSSNEVLQKHQVLCSQHSAQAIEMPKPGENILKFSKFGNTFPIPYVIYADFETFISPKNDVGRDRNTVITAEHIPCGFCYVVVGPDGMLVKKPVKYRGEDVVSNFLACLLAEEKEIKDKVENFSKNPVPIIMTPKDIVSFASAKACGICKKEFRSNEEKVKDHCHITGKFRQAAHNACNLAFKPPKYIPVVFHNLRGYDSHLIFQKLGEVENSRITCIPNTVEKYMSFSVGSLRFIDSLQFLNASLDTLVSNLAREGSEHFKVTKSQYPTPEKLKLLLRKGVYPYEYVTDETIFDERQLPPKDVFYSSLTEENISDSDYEHAKTVWDTFGMKTFGDYHDLYLLSDVLLTCDVFQRFRSTCLKNYELDPCHYITTPGLSFDACLKMTQVELELLTDLDMHLFIEAGLRGGVSVISRRHSQANNKYMGDDYNPDDPSKYIIYWDMNNLYGHAMSQYLPEGGFRFLNADERENFRLETKPSNGNLGYILSVDLEYPEELHDLHNDYPLAPEQVQITHSMLSKYSKRLLRTSNSKPAKVKKLVPNLNKKENYIIHFENLKFYLSLGMTLKAVHQILEFRQSPWLAKYIEFNTELRKRANNDFDRELTKLFNNSMYGKCLECLRDRLNVSFAQNERQAKRLVAKPQFQEFKIFSEDLVAVHCLQPKVLLNRPICAGFAVLELSKLAMYEFHYNYVKKKYGNNATLLFTDTDSLCYQIETDDIYHDMLSDLDLFDTSNYPSSHMCYSVKNKKVVGKMKDECDGKIISEFVGLRAKMYSLKEQQGKIKKVGKGIVKTTLKKHITHEDYVNTLIEEKISRAFMTTIESKNHNIHTVSRAKITLSPFDDKRYILPDGKQTFAHGHYKIEDIAHADFNESGDIEDLGPKFWDGFFED